MRIMRVGAVNFKGFQQLDLDVNGRSMVVFGENGMGKSTMLSIITYLFWPFVNKLNQSQGKLYQSLDATLVRNGASEMGINMDVEGHSGIYTLERIYEKGKFGKKAIGASSTTYTDFLTDFTTEKYDENLSILIYYGVNRANTVISVEPEWKDQLYQSAVYEKCLDNVVDFKAFFSWFRNREDIENEIKIATKDMDYRDRSLECVRNAIMRMLDDVTAIRVKRNPARLIVKKNGDEYDVNQLSDGEKCVMAMIGDIARRLAIANPKDENPLQGDGIVMIDEIELHLHPAWQRKIIHVLRKLFPNIQFIITTHSPQVLGSVEADILCCKLTADGENGTQVSQVNVYGKDSNGILLNMDAVIRDAAAEKRFAEFYDALDDGQLEEAEKILGELEADIEDDAELAGCRVKLDLEKMGDF